MPRAPLEPEPGEEALDHAPSDRGFTLIELMVVLLIIAILLAVMIPTFLGSRDKALNRSAEADLRNALTAAKTLYSDSGDYSGAASATSLQSVEPSLSFTTGSTSTPGQVSVSVAVDYETIDLATLSGSGNCFYLQDVASASASSGTWYASQSGSNSSCVAPASGGALSSPSRSPGAAGW
jgi:type IV pilus assembly protein PilA